MGRFKVAVDGRAARFSSNGSLRMAADRQPRRRPAGRPLAKLVGLELATKLVVMTIPPLTVAGMLWVAREVTNRLPPTVAFALPLAFGHPFMFGFVNFALSMALALLAFGLWLRLGRLGQVEAARRCCSCRSASSSISPIPSAGGRSACSASRPRRFASTIAATAGGWRMPRCTHGDGAAAGLILLWRSEATGGLTIGWFDWELQVGISARAVFRDRWENVRPRQRRRARLSAVRGVHPRLTLSRNLAFSGLVLPPATSCCRASSSARPMPTCGWCPMRRDLHPRDPLQGRDDFPLARPGWRSRAWPSCQSGSVELR